MSHRLALALAAVLALSACTRSDGGPTSTNPTPSSTTTTVFDDEGIRRFRECLALEGVGIAPIETDGTGRPRLDIAIGQLDLEDPGVNQTVSNCSDELGSGALDLSSDELLRQVVLSQLNKFSECMREKGIDDFPDPEPGFNGVGHPYAVADIPYSDPALGAVATVCSERLLDG